MSDLSDTQAAGSTKLIGSDNAGVEQTPVQSTSSGGLHVNLRGSAGTEIATITNPLLISSQGSYTTVSGATTVTLKSGSGLLTRIVINRPTNGTATVYDNTTGTGTVIAIISYTNGTAPSFLEYGLSFSTGLTIVTTGTNTNITVIYT